MEELAIHDKGFVLHVYPTTSKIVRSDTGFK